MFTDFRERERERETERYIDVREKNRLAAPYTHSNQGLNGNLGMHLDWKSNV